MACNLGNWRGRGSGKKVWWEGGEGVAEKSGRMLESGTQVRGEMEVWEEEKEERKEWGN
jgi:hypothetical protein